MVITRQIYQKIKVDIQLFGASFWVSIKLLQLFSNEYQKADDGKIISKKYLNIKGKIALEVYNNLIKIAGPQLFNILKNVEKKDKFIFKNKKKEIQIFGEKGILMMVR